MTQVTTKFNVGDRVVALDNKTLKIRELQIASMLVTVTRESQSVSIYPVGDDGSANYYDKYEEERCFSTREELLDYITK